MHFSLEYVRTPSERSTDNATFDHLSADVGWPLGARNQHVHRRPKSTFRVRVPRVAAGKRKVTERREDKIRRRRRLLRQRSRRRGKILSCSRLVLLRPRRRARHSKPEIESMRRGETSQSGTPTFTLRDADSKRCRRIVVALRFPHARLLRHRKRV